MGCCVDIYSILYNKLRYFELGETENLRIVMELGSVIGPIFVISKIDRKYGTRS